MLIAAGLGLVGAIVVGPLLGRAGRWWMAEREPEALPVSIVGVSLVTGVVFAACAARLGWSWRLGPVLVGMSAVVAAAAVDLRCRRVPTAFVWVGGGGALAVAVGTGAWSAVAAGAVGALMYGGFLTVTHLLVPTQLGGGDARLGWLLGALVGWVSGDAEKFTPGSVFASVQVALLLSIALGLATHIVAALRGRELGYLPFGPAMGIGALGALLLQAA